MGRLSRRLSERAQATAELAMILPFMALMLGSVFVLGQAFVETQMVAGAASEAARKASFSFGSPNRDALAKAAGYNAAETGDSSFNPDDMDIVIAWPSEPGSEVRVQVSYPIQIDFGVFEIDETVVRTRSMRVIQ